MKPWTKNQRILLILLIGFCAGGVTSRPASADTLASPLAYDGAIAIFALGLDDGPYVVYQDQPPYGGFSATPRYLSGALKQIAVSPLADKSLLACGVGMDDQIYCKQETGPNTRLFSPWLVRMAGSFADVSMALDATGRAYICALRKVDQQPFCLSQQAPGGAWNASATAMTGALKQLALIGGPGRPLAVCGVDTVNGLSCRIETQPGSGQFGSYRSLLAGPFKSVALTSDANHYTQVWAINSQFAPYVTYESAPGSWTFNRPLLSLGGGVRNLTAGVSLDGRTFACGLGLNQPTAGQVYCNWEDGPGRGTFSRGWLLNQTGFYLYDWTMATVALPTQPPADPPVRDPMDMLSWIDSMLDSTYYVGVHAENFDTTRRVWTSNTAFDANRGLLTSLQSVQPFKTMVDWQRSLAYWRKDDVPNFYGELWAFTQNNVTLVAETEPAPIPQPPLGIYPASAPPDWVGWQPGQPCPPSQPNCCPDAPANPLAWCPMPYHSHFYVSLSEGGGQSFPLSAGRVLASRRLDIPFNLQNATLNTFICHNWNELESGACQILQPDFLDKNVFITRMAPFSTLYDGLPDATPMVSVFDPPGTLRQNNIAISQEVENFDEAIVINQVMGQDANGNPVGRERFYFARRGDRYYGIVRWDSSVFDTATGNWVVQYRTTALEISQASNFSFDGFITERAPYARLNRAGLRLVEGINDANSSTYVQSCPLDTIYSGAFRLTYPTGTLALYDVSGLSASTATLAICNRNGLSMTLASQCPPQNTRGQVQAPLANIGGQVVSNQWLALCAASPADNRSTLTLATSGCPAGTQPSGSFFSGACIDAAGRPCAPSGDWVVVCSAPDGL